jgi:hypothetical protein
MSETPYSSWSDSICGEDNSVNDNIYGWSAWTASDAGPAVTSTSGTWTHGSTNAVIGGYSFGTKSPVAPLMWDNGEDSTVDSDAAVTGTAGSKTRGLHNPWPPPSTASVAACRLRYRDAPYRSIAAPHTRSSQYLAGCHYQFADNNPQYISAEDVGQVDNQYRAVGACGLADADSSNWYMHFYYRIDDTWSIEGSSGLQPNHKMTTWGNDSPWGMYDSVGVNYTVYCGGLSPETETGDTTRLSLADSNNNSLGNCTSAPYGNNPNDRWIKIEEMLSATSRDLWIDNTHAIQTATVANTRSACFGGYFRYTVGPEAQYNPNYRGGVLDSNYRYFDDIYIDITRARVMLCNVSTYPTTDAGVCEPQIPHTTWNDTTIQITVNQGALSAGTNYLFVFDSDNTANTTGYPVTLGSITTPPSAKGLIMKGATWK